MLDRVGMGLWNTYAKDSQADGTQGLENNNDREIDLETVDVVVVEIAVEPAD